MHNGTRWAGATEAHKVTTPALKLTAEQQSQAEGEKSAAAKSTKRFVSTGNEYGWHGTNLF